MAKNKDILIIDPPVGFPGDIVNVENYNCSPAHWENAVISETNLKFRSKKDYYYQYRVELVRKSDKGNYLFLTLGKGHIKKI